MKISTLNSKLNLLAVGTNAKTIKSDTELALTAIMYLAPNTISGYDTCPAATPGCIASCLFTAGRGAMNTVAQARIRKTKLFFENQSHFLKLLRMDLDLFKNYCIEQNLQGFVRLNGTSDILWENFNIINNYEDLNFYDYTKIKNRDISKLTNYKLTFSRDENMTNQEIYELTDSGFNVAIVFEKVPTVWNKIPVIEGDLSDMRWDDPSGVIVGLKEKGKAKKDLSDFVIRV